MIQSFLLQDPGQSSSQRGNPKVAEIRPQEVCGGVTLPEDRPIPVLVEITQADIDEMIFWSEENFRSDPFSCDALISAIRRVVKPEVSISITLTNGKEEVIIGDYHSMLSPEILMWLRRLRGGLSVEPVFGVVWIPGELVIPEWRVREAVGGKGRES